MKEMVRGRGWRGSGRREHVMDYLKCPTCKDIQRVSGFIQKKGGAPCYTAGPVPATLSLEQETALTLAGRVHKQRCPECQDLWEMHGITG
jgi:hypothetical protein